MKAAQAARQTPARLDLLRLESHHSGPRYLVIRPREKPRRGMSSYQWQYWPAPWRKGSGKGQSNQFSFNNKGRGKGQDKSGKSDSQQHKQQENQRFPKYDQARTNQQHFLEVSSDAGQSTADDGLVKELQKCVNVARKAEQKVSSLQKQLQTKHTQWENFQLELKQTFIKEQQRFQQDVHRLNAELASAEESQAEARAVVRGAARGEGLVQTGPSEEMERQWMSKVTAWEQEGHQEDKTPPDAVLRRALEAATATAPVISTDLRTPQRPTRTGIASPCRSQLPHCHGHGGAGGQSNAQSSLVKSAEPTPTYTLGATTSPQARTDPYLAPKTAPKPPRRVAATSPEGTHRTSVKDLSKAKTPLHTPSPGMSLAEKLEARRLAMTGPPAGEMIGAEKAHHIADVGEVGHIGPPSGPDSSAQKNAEPYNSSSARPQNFLLYDDGDLSDVVEEDLSDMEMWYNNFSNSGGRDLQELE